MCAINSVLFKKIELMNCTSELLYEGVCYTIFDINLQLYELSNT